MSARALADEERRCITSTCPTTPTPPDNMRHEGVARAIPPPPAVMKHDFTPPRPVEQAGSASDYSATAAVLRMGANLGRSVFPPLNSSQLNVSRLASRGG